MRKYVLENLRQSRLGFTLIELMIVIALMGILSVGGFTAYGTSQKNTRDHDRKTDLEAIKQALEVYRSENGVYPGRGQCDSSVGFEATANCPPTPLEEDWSSSSDIVSKLEPLYIKDLPIDPINDATYYYEYSPVCDVAVPGINVCGLDDIDCTGRGCCAYRLESRMEVSGGNYRICSPG